VAAFAGAWGARGRIIVVLSGGGSAHLTLPSGNLTLDDLRGVNDALQRAGAPITALNAVRKHTERLKGGRLALPASSVPTTVYALSDVVGDRLDTIASGPFAPDATTFGDAIGVLERYGVKDACARILAHLEAGGRGEIAETPKPGDPALARVEHVVIGNNRAVIDAAGEAIGACGFRVAAMQEGVEGESASVGRELARQAIRAARAGDAACVIFGGEPTVRVGSATGRGGPSQELALAAAIELAASSEQGLAQRVAIVSLSTDGIDGPTDFAGAIVTAQTAARIADPAAALAAHASTDALDRAGALLRTGPTGTNVNHVAAALVYGA
jgi:hydroxypyruvate reductase